MNDNLDPKVNNTVSAIVLLAAALITASVYTTYSDDKSIGMYEELDASYTQTAATFMSLKELDKTNTTITNDEVSDTTDAADLADTEGVSSEIELE